MSKYEKEIVKNNDRNQKKRLAESEPQDDSETDLEGVISDYENTNPKDRFITVEEKQIKFQKVWNPEIQTENKSGKGYKKKSQKKLIDKYGK